MNARGTRGQGAGHRWQRQLRGGILWQNRTSGPPGGGRAMSKQRTKNRIEALCMGAVLAALGGRANAAPNGLTQIPIAKVFGDGVGAFSLAHSQLDSTSTVDTAQYG